MMTNGSLLRAKISQPPVPRDYLPRPRCVSLLPNGLIRRVILVTAPAGYGKTALISEWLGKCSVPAAWIQLSPNDNVPDIFWAYFFFAIQTRFPEMLKSESGPALWNRPSMEGLSLLINRFEQSQQRLVLVLDNFHHIQHPDILKKLTWLIEYQPKNFCLVLIGRRPPALSLARHLVDHQALTLRVNALRFSRPETSAFIQSMRLNLTSEQIVMLDENFEGWIAGLKLSAMLLQKNNHSNAIESLFSGCQREIREYVHDEIFQKQPDSLQQFLLETSILDTMTRDLCDAVTGRRDGAAKLQKILTQQLFIQPLDQEEREFRYNRFFHDFLRQMLIEKAPHSVPTLHFNAMHWHQKKGNTQEALLHALAAGELKEAAHAAEKIVLPLLMKNDLRKLETCFNNLPLDLILDFPRLALAFAWIKVIQNPNFDINPILEVIQEKIKQHSLSSTEKAEISGHLSAIRAHRAHHQGDACQADNLILETYQNLSPQEHGLRGIIALELGRNFFLKNELGKAVSHYEEARFFACQSYNYSVALDAINKLGIIHAMKGELQQARALYNEGISLAESWGKSKPLIAVAPLYIGIGALAYEVDDRKKAEIYFEEALKIGRQSGDCYPIVYAVIGSTWLKRFSESDKALQEQLNTVIDCIKKHPNSNITRRWFAFQARLALFQGDLAGARRWANYFLQYHREADFTCARAYEFLTLARIRLRSGDNGITDWLMQWFPLAQQDGRERIMIEISLLHAIAKNAMGKTSQAVATFKNTIAMSASKGYIHLIVDEGYPVYLLLNKIDQQGFMTKTVQKLLSVSERIVAHTAEQHREYPALEQDDPRIPSPLSPREVEVLGLAALGLTNKEIALQLHLSAGTIKWHMSNIFTKLEAKNRLHAVEKARQKKLL
jgi:LuxR family maltose regulon positive regulatory protein